ncbi:MAG: YkgJ family cysteine cluster protein [Sphaerochaeta sp.]|jgi:Fe-S-cluster containining protein|nr:YkgJ family cysteine cluster protein [Sphaerochaeta sp.]
MNHAIIEILSVLKETHHHQRLERLSSLYEQIEDETGRFKDEYSIGCGPGCGTCCEHFNPDITALEASLVAAHLLVDGEKRHLINRLYTEGVDGGPCPLYDKGSPYHCTVYAVRPLICRLFGAASSADKNGRAIFRRCKYNREETMPLSLTFDRPVPLMQHYSYALRSLDEGRVDILSVQVRQLVEELQFLISLIEGSAFNDDDSPLAS